MSENCSYLSAEVAEVLGVLGDLHLLDGLTEGGTVTGAVLADDSDLLGALGLEKEISIGVILTEKLFRTFSRLFDRNHWINWFKNTCGGFNCLLLSQIIHV